MYERGNMISESQVKAEEGGKFLFNALFLLGEHDPTIELRVYEKDGTGKPVSLANCTGTVRDVLRVANFDKLFTLH